MGSITVAGDPTTDSERLLLIGEGLAAAAAALRTELDGVRVVEADDATGLDRLVADDADAAVIAHRPPMTDGVAVVRALRERASTLPVVLVVSAPDRAVVEAAVAAGASDVVAAGTPPALLARRVENALLARRSHDRAVHPGRSFLSTLTERLTARQLEVLETAHDNGYFEWPRHRTGEELADLLGVTQPTFNNHLRVAERKLYDLLFDEARAE